MKKYVVKITTTASYLMVTLISIVPPRMWYCIWFMVFLGIGSSSGFQLAIPSILALTPQVRKSMWIFWQLWDICVTTIHPRPGEITRGWVQQHTVPIGFFGEGTEKD